MAFAAKTDWEVRTTGSDNNGGGWNSASSGTDRSQQDAAFTAYTDLVIDATTNTKITSAAFPFGATDVGNVINVTAGTGFTVQRIQVVSVTAAVATCDKAVGTLGSTGGTGNLGGALASPGQAGAVKVAGNRVFIKNGTYSLTSATANVSGGMVNDTTGGVDQTNVSRWIGYSSTRSWGNTDTKPLLQASGAISSFTILKSGGSHVEFYNLSVDCATKTTSTGIDVNQSYTRAIRCKVANATSRGIWVETVNEAFALLCEVTGCSGTVGIDVESGAKAILCESHGNTVHGFRFGFGGLAVSCLAYANTGASTDGFASNSVGYFAINCTSYGNGRAGFDVTSNVGFGSVFLNCLAEGNSGAGFSSDGVKEAAFLYNCGGYNNTSGNYSSTNLTNVVAFQAATGSFFTNAGTGDFSLNNTASAGALARQAGLPGVYPAGTTTGYEDIGGARHQDPAAGGGLITNPGMAGGMHG